MAQNQNFNNSSLQKAQMANYFREQAMKNANLARIANEPKPEAIQTTAKVTGKLEFIFNVTNTLETQQPVLLFDANDQYKYNVAGAPTNEGIEIVGTKKNYQGFLNQLIGCSFRVTEVNVEVAEGGSNQLGNSISLYTNSLDNNAAIFEKSITPSLFKYSGQYLPNLIETSDEIYLDLFSAWVFQLNALTSYTFRIFCANSKSFR